MTSKERVLTALRQEQPDRTPLWLGHPMPEVVENLSAHYGASDREDLLRKIGDDFRWAGVFHWRAPDGRWPFDMTGLDPMTFNNVDDVMAMEMPNLDYVDVSETRTFCLMAKEYAIYGGSWSHFFHQVWDVLGAENYMIMMHEAPGIVEALTDRIVDFHIRLNEKIYREAGDLIDFFFFGNDLGTQRGLLFSRAMFQRFIQPGMEKLIKQAKTNGLHVWLHSCGSVREIIPDLIEIGVEALHPVQVSAAGMDVTELGREFGGKLLFVGGVDVHQLLRLGTPDEVREAVRYNRRVLGPGYVVSPSHEAVLPDIPTANLVAMIEAATHG